MVDWIVVTILGGGAIFKLLLITAPLSKVTTDIDWFKVGLIVILVIGTFGRSFVGNELYLISNTFIPGDILCFG